MAALVGGLLAAARQRAGDQEAADHRDQKTARDPREIFVDERLDRRPEQPEQYADEQEGKGAAREARTQEGDEIHVDEAGGDRQQLERDRRRALHQYDLGPIVAQIAGRGGEAAGQPERAERPQPDAVIEEIADRIAKAAARDRRERADDRIPYRLLLHREAHQPDNKEEKR